MPRGALWLLLLAGCRPTPPGVLVGESAHFRLYVDPALMARVTFYWYGTEDPAPAASSKGFLPTLLLVFTFNGAADAR